MLDVHPPHHPTHTWKDFFIHIATIVVGLLIAVGLEQTVEVIHHHDQRRHLEQALADDWRKQADDADRCEIAMNVQIAALTQRIAQVHAAAATHRPVAPEAALAYPDCDALSKSSSSAARSSGLLAVLGEEEVRASSENDLVVETFNSVGIFPWIAAGYKLQQFELPFRSHASSDAAPDLSGATPAELDRYAVFLGDLLADSIAIRDNAQYARGSARALLDGERDLSHIQKAERLYVVPIGSPPVR